MILPLFWAFERAIHGVTLHIWWSLGHKEYSPGLLSSILFWVLLHLICKHGYAAGLISDFDFWMGGLSGILGAAFITLGPTVIFPRRAAKKRTATLAIH